ncbi:PBP1A family penicillin-binding protein [Sphingomonas koreensis]|nr:PBP1A family penicillin-binding protein [Sphingomonas koreensis]
MARASTSRKKKQPAAGWRRWLVRALWACGALALLAVISLFVAVYATRNEIPSFDELKSSPNGQMIRVHAADGTVIASLGPSYGEWLSYDQVPQVMREATVSVEDRRFRDHIGVDPVALVRIAWFAINNYDTGRRLQGASTITQQVARTIFLSNSYSVKRKLREAIVALALERKFTKDQILELYMNKVYYGGGAYGIDAAARKFFGHSATHLTLGEAAVIAGLVKAPSHYSPTADAEAAIGRAGVVLQLMQETGAITPQQAAEADISAVKLAPEPKQNSVRYFTDWALPQLETLIDESSRPLEVYTTLDLNMQRAATRAVNENVPAGAQGALVALDQDGSVRAMVGGKDYVSSIYNRATQAVRQPGSSFKLFVYLAALEAGIKPDDPIVDEPVTIKGWTPRNDSRRNIGQTTIRTAFAYSINTIAAKLGLQVGFDTVADMARRFGITTPVSTYPSMVLGTSEVRLIDMTRAFASVGAQGVAVTPFGITKVTADGVTIYQHQVDRSHVLVAPYVAQEMTDLLASTVNIGTGRAADIGRPVAGKTGTTQNNHDGWFLGFSSGLTTGVWMGRDDSKPIPGLFGGRGPARAFADFMRPAVANRPIQQFQTTVTVPDWQTEDENSYFGEPDNGLFVDENGNPVQPDQIAPDEQSGAQPYDDPGYPPDGSAPPVREQQAPPPPAQGEQLNQDWMDRVLGRSPRDRPRSAPMPQPDDRSPDQESRPNQ